MCASVIVSMKSSQAASAFFGVLTAFRLFTKFLSWYMVPPSITDAGLYRRRQIQRLANQHKIKRAVTSAYCRIGEVRSRKREIMSSCLTVLSQLLASGGGLYQRRQSLKSAIHTSDTVTPERHPTLLKLLLRMIFYDSSTSTLNQMGGLPTLLDLLPTSSPSLLQFSIPNLVVPTFKSVLYDLWSENSTERNLSLGKVSFPIDQVTTG